MSNKFKHFECSKVSEEAGEPTIGSARQVPEFLLIEWPRPWDASALNTESLPDEIQTAYSEASRNNQFVGKCLLFDRDPEYSGDEFRVFYYTLPDPPHAQYQKEEYLVPQVHLADLCTTILQNAEERNKFDEYRHSDRQKRREIFVCNHRERDPCCGKYGAELFLNLRNEYANPNRRIWKISHIGGHRFAPNVIDFPDGRYWGRLQENELDNFIYRNGSFEQIAERYRGWCALSTPEQVAEQDLLIEHDWAWMRQKKEATLQHVPSDRDQFQVEFQCHPEEGDTETFSRNVQKTEAIERLGTPCGEVYQQPRYKTSEQYEVVS